MGNGDSCQYPGSAFQACLEAKYLSPRVGYHYREKTPKRNLFLLDSNICAILYIELRIAKILANFGDEEKTHCFWEDSPINIAYKDLYIGDILEEIHLTLDGKTMPLSAVNHSIVTNAQEVLKKEHLVWYVKRERGCVD